jgi:hypothetical protein
MRGFRLVLTIGCSRMAGHRIREVSLGKDPRKGLTGHGVIYMLGAEIRNRLGDFYKAD